MSVRTAATMDPLAARTRAPSPTPRSTRSPSNSSYHTHSCGQLTGPQVRPPSSDQRMQPQQGFCGKGPLDIVCPVSATTVALPAASRSIRALPSQSICVPSGAGGSRSPRSQVAPWSWL